MEDTFLEDVQAEVGYLPQLQMDGQQPESTATTTIRLPRQNGTITLVFTTSYTTPSMFGGMGASHSTTEVDVEVDGPPLTDVELDRIYDIIAKRQY